MRDAPIRRHARAKDVAADKVDILIVQEYRDVLGHEGFLEVGWVDGRQPADML